MISLKMNNRRTTALYYVGAVGTLVAVYEASVSALTLSLCVHILVISLFSAVVHRYFCHRAYEANPTLMWLLAFIPVAYGYSTPSGWAALHSAHHAYADTDKDTHLKGWAGLFTANYRMPPLKFALAGKWFHGDRHSFYTTTPWLSYWFGTPSCCWYLLMFSCGLVWYRYLRFTFVTGFTVCSATRALKPITAGILSTSARWG